jgi:hypothetical protein
VQAGEARQAGRSGRAGRAREEAAEAEAYVVALEMSVGAVELVVLVHEGGCGVGKVGVGIPRD